MPVEYEVGGTIDRLAKARVAKGNPLVDLNFTTTHVARLYISDGLYDKLDMAKLPNAKEIAKEAIRSDYHLGLVGLRLHDRLPAGPGEGRDHEVVGSLEARRSRARSPCPTSTLRTSSRSPP